MLERALKLSLAATLTLALACGCDRDTSASQRAQPETWSWESASGYALELPTRWERFDTEVIDNGADFAARHGEQLFMVIPVEIPDVGSGPPPLEEFKEAGVAQLKRDVPAFELLDERAQALDGTPAITLTASGEINGHPSRYLITYVQRDGWRYQIVAWGHAASADALTREVDALLGTWRFRPAREDASEERDAGHAPPRD